MKRVPFDLVVLRNWMQIISRMQMWGMEEESYMEGCSSAPAPPLSASDSAAWKHKTLLTTHFFKLIKIILKRHSLSCDSRNVWVLSLKWKMNYTMNNVSVKLCRIDRWRSMTVICHIQLWVVHLFSVVPILFLTATHWSLLCQLMSSWFSWALRSSLSRLSSFRANVSFLFTRLASPPVNQMAHKLSVSSDI